MNFAGGGSEPLTPLPQDLRMMWSIGFNSLLFNDIEIVMLLFHSNILTLKQLLISYPSDVTDRLMMHMKSWSHIHLLLIKILSLQQFGIWNIFKDCKQGLEKKKIQLNPKWNTNSNKIISKINTYLLVCMITKEMNFSWKK